MERISIFVGLIVGGRIDIRRPVVHTARAGEEGVKASYNFRLGFIYGVCQISTSSSRDYCILTLGPVRKASDLILEIVEDGRKSWESQLIELLTRHSRNQKI